MKPVALVTGASRGLGLEWCRQLGLDGYQVILTARSEDKAEAAAEALRKEGFDVVGKALDVSSEASISTLAVWVAMNYSQLDVLVNNAGLNSKDESKELFSKSMHLATLSPDEIVRHMRVNAIGPVLMVKNLRSMLKLSQRPVVVSIGSWLGSVTNKDFGGHYSYSSSKSALNMLNRAMALEIKSDNIVAVVINPGWVRTQMGGEKAHLSPTESVRSMINNVVCCVTLEQTGLFFNWDGSFHPW
jgi:NAD(P)-dependent dehydrogenase (short-subunit alcohol dehydrogenase family)